MIVIKVGVLALQGGFDTHRRTLAALGAEPRIVRRARELSDLAGLVIPGGETTTLLRLMDDEPWFDALRAFHRQGGALFGTCAGAILLAREVRSPAQPALGLIDATVERNAYGRQVDSFETALDAPALGGPVAGVFIRAPRLTRVGPRVEVLARREGEPVLVAEGRVLAATFHPELAGEGRVHRLFLDLAAQRERVTA